LVASDPASTLLVEQLFSDLNRAGAICTEETILNIVIFFAPEPDPINLPPGGQAFFGLPTGDLYTDLGIFFDFVGIPIVN